MKAAQEMTDRELIEALEMAAPRARLAGADDLRNVADVIADLALEASRRLKEIEHVDPERRKLRDRISRLEDAAFHFQTCGTCKRQGEDFCSSGRRFSAFLRGEDPPTLEGEPGPLLGSVRNVTLHADGRLTADLTVNDAGARFVQQITGQDPK